LPAAPKAFPFVVYALGSLVILVLGLVDDRRRLSAGFKLLVQTIVAVGVAVGGVPLLAGSSFLGVALQTGQPLIAAMIVPLLGACAGFLLFNFPPAKIFLG